MKKLFYSLTVLLAVIQLSSCAKKEGCTDPTSPNYNADAEKDNGSCIDMTSFITGSFTGDFTETEQSTGDETLYEDETYIVTKINNSTVFFESESGDLPSFTAEIVDFNALSTSFDIPEFTVNGVTFDGVEITTGADGLLDSGEIEFEFESVDGEIHVNFTGVED
jgi:hypothetical protein